MTAGIFVVWLVVLGIQRYVNSAKNGERQDSSGTPSVIGGETGKKLSLGRKILHYTAFVVIILLSVATLELYGITDWRKQQTQETASEKDARATKKQAQLVQAKQDTFSKKIIVVAKPGVWSAEQEIPMDGWKHWIALDGEVKFVADNGPVREDGPGKLTDYGRNTRVIRFMSAENRDVNVTITLVPK